MSYCLSPHCPQPQNPDDSRFCQACGAPLLLQGRYRALKPLSPGGFSKTFLAIDEGTGRQICVIKQLYCANHNPIFRQKVVELFDREARRLEDLGPHSQIPDFFAHFEEGGQHYIVQEFVDGQTLAEELAKKGAFSEVQIRQLLKDVLPIIHFIHHNQVIHRDIKPENLIRRLSDGKLMLIDFGAAKAITEATPFQPGTNIGTTGYAAPEQLRGQAIFASDLYSLGVTCIHLLTQMEPFDLYDANQAAFVWKDYLVNNPVSPELSQILDRLVRITASERYPSAISVMTALSEKGILRRSRSSIQNAIATKPSYLSTQSSQAPSQVSSQSSPVASRAIGPDIHYTNLRLVAILQNGQGAVWSVAFSPNGTAVASGSGGVSKLGFISGDEDSTVKLWDLAHWHVVKTLSSHGDRVRAVSFSPNGQLLASASEDKTIHLHDLTTDHVTVLRGHPDPLHFLAFSPDGKTIAASSGGYDAYRTQVEGKVMLWNVATGQIVQFLLAGAIVNVPLAFSPDGGLLALPVSLWVKDKNCHVIKLLRLKTQKTYYLHPPPSLQANSTTSPHVFHALAFSPDGKFLASSSSLGVQLWDVENRKLVQQLHQTSDRAQYSRLVFSPDGEMLACVRAGRLYLWDMKHPLKTYCPPSIGFLSVAISPNGRAIAAGRKDGTIHLWQCI